MVKYSQPIFRNLVKYIILYKTFIIVGYSQLIFYLILQFKNIYRYVSNLYFKNKLFNFKNYLESINYFIIIFPFIFL